MAKENQQPPGPPVQRRYHIDTGPIAVVLFVAALLWVLCAFWGDCSWSDILDRLQVHDRERFTALAQFAGVLLALLAAAKVFYTRRR